MAGAEDAAACARLMAGSEPWLTLGRSYERALQIIADPTREVTVAVRDGAVIGFVIVCMTGAFVGYIQTVAVAPEERGRGLGARLVAHAEARIFRESPNVFLCVSTFNDGARRLYERLGYVEVGELTDYLVRGHGEVLLRKTRGPWSEFGEVG
jgi:ribosomal protein S18 acetylase RimI-like enzyme